MTHDKANEIEIELAMSVGVSGWQPTMKATINLDELGLTLDATNQEIYEALERDSDLIDVFISNKVSVWLNEVKR